LTCPRTTDKKEPVVCLFPGPIMARQFLSLLLAATQLASWGASPLYLCVARGGSVCIDRGCESCHCCHDLDDCASLCLAACDRSPADAHAEDEVHPADHDSPAVSDACGCTHYLIVQQQGPVVARGPVGAGNPSQAGRLIARDGSQWAATRLPGIDLAVHPPGPLPMMPAGLQTLAPVVLRC
jgi:hypothetical protein